MNEDFNFPSKPVQLNDGMVLLENGSIYLYNNGNSFLLYEHRSTKKKATVPLKDELEDEFKYMWAMWTEKIPNNSVRQSSYREFIKLNKAERDALAYSIDRYSTTNEPKYLVKCAKFIKEKMWEGVDQFVENKSSSIPDGNDDIWDIYISHPDTGILETAKIQVYRFGMSRELAIELARKVK